MKAVIYDRKNKSEPFALREVEKPAPGAGEVLVRIACTSLNAADYRSMSMGIVPESRIYGADVAGVVEAMGSGASRFQVGDAVFGDLAGAGFGGLAEYAAAPERYFALKPAGVSFEQAAAVPMAALTALQALRDEGKVRAGQTVLIYGAGGGVGTFAVQLARQFGADVTAVCGPGNVERVRSLGARRVIDYTLEDITRGGETFDLVLGVNGSQPLSVYRRLLKPDGTAVMVGGALSQVIKTMLFGPLLSVGRRKMRLLKAKASAEDLAFVIRLVEVGEIEPVIDRTYPLEQAGEAVKYVRKGHARGKVVVEVGG